MADKRLLGRWAPIMRSATPQAPSPPVSKAFSVKLLFDPAWISAPLQEALEDLECTVDRMHRMRIVHRPGLHTKAHPPIFFDMRKDKAQLLVHPDLHGISWKIPRHDQRNRLSIQHRVINRQKPGSRAAPSAVFSETRRERRTRAIEPILNCLSSEVKRGRRTLSPIKQAFSSNPWGSAKKGLAAALAL
jgi:hypothetical protein